MKRNPAVSVVLRTVVFRPYLIMRDFALLWIR